MLEKLLTPAHSAEKRKIFDAINKLGLKVTPANISIETSLPLWTATRQLNLVAAETGAHLRVDSSGGLTYEFRPGFEASYILDIGKKLFLENGSFLIKFLTIAFKITVRLSIALLRILFSTLVVLLRISFGIILIASVLLIIFGIIAALTGGDGGGGDGVDFGGLGDFNCDFGCDFGHALGDIVNLFDGCSNWGDPFYHSDSGYSYYTQSSYTNSPTRHEYSTGYDTTSGTILGGYTASNGIDSSGSKGAAKSPDFLSNCFSYLFGDGLPNADLESRYWHQIGTVIRRNFGVVVAEQLSPYTGKDSSNEDWMLPILVHFNGTPEVTETGNIIYVFPAMQNSTDIKYSARPLTEQPCQADELRQLYQSHLTRQALKPVHHSNSEQQLPRFLQERNWSFSLAPTTEVTFIAFLSALNLIGSDWLYWFAQTTKLPFIHALAPYLLGYAIFFAFFPLLRLAVISILNIGINSRNARRSRFASELGNPDEELSQKLAEAAELIHAAQRQAPTTTVYTTEKDSLEQLFEEQQRRFL